MCTASHFQATLRNKLAIIQRQNQVPSIYVQSTRLYSLSASEVSRTLDDSVDALYEKFSTDPQVAFSVNERKNSLISKNPIGALKHLRWKTDLEVKKADKYLKYSKENFSAEDVSIFVNRLIGSYEQYKDILGNEVWRRIYHIYRVFVVNPRHRKLNAMILKDLNQFIEIFLKMDDIHFARGIFSLILKNSRNQDLPEDTETIKMYLRLYCGAISKYWVQNSMVDFYESLTKSFSRINSDTFGRQTAPFKSVPAPLFRSLLKKLLEDPEYSALRTTELDALLIRSLGHYGETDFIKKYIEAFYGISEEGTLHQIQVDLKQLQPDSQLLSSILETFYKSNAQITALLYFRSFINHYPNIDISVHTWRKLMFSTVEHWNKCKGEEEAESDAAESHRKSWDLLLHYHKLQGKTVPFDRKIMLYRLYFNSRHNDLDSVLKDVQTVFKDIYFKTERNTFISEKLVLYSYQRYILKRLARHHDAAACEEFVRNWKLDEANGKFMEDLYLRELKKAVDNAEQKGITKKGSIADEDDFDFPLFGTNIL